MQNGVNNNVPFSSYIQNIRRFVCNTNVNGSLLSTFIDISKMDIIISHGAPGKVDERFILWEDKV